MGGDWAFLGERWLPPAEVPRSVPRNSAEDRGAGPTAPERHGKGSQGRASRETGSHSDSAMQATRLLQFTCSPISLSAPLRRNIGAPPRSSRPRHRRVTKNAAAHTRRRTCSIVRRHLQARRPFACNSYENVSRRNCCNLFEVCAEPTRSFAAQKRATL